MAAVYAFQAQANLPSNRDTEENSGWGNAEFEQSVESLKNRLYTVLQTTLDLNELLPLFKRHAGELIEFGSFQFHNHHANFHYEWNAEQSCRCLFPLCVDDEYLGEISFSRQVPFSKSETQVLRSLTGTVIYPIRNGLRYREAVHSAVTDPLTGAGNRSSLEHSIRREYELSQRYQQPLSVLMIDLDHFKAVNDRFGHSTGDAVLKAAAQTIQNETRCADVTFRFGGEEFVVLLAKTNLEGASIIAERIRSAISQLNCLPDNSCISASIGCATLEPEESCDALLQKADMALYRAKRKGRNRVNF